MLSMHYNELDQASQLIYMEVATNPSLNIILTKEKEQIEQQLLNLRKPREQSNEDFVLSYTELVVQRRMLLELIEINQLNIKQIQQER